MDASVGGAVVDWRTVQSVEASVPGRRRRQSVVPSSFFFFSFFFLYHSPRRSFLTDNKLVLVVERGREVFLFLFLVFFLERPKRSKVRAKGFPEIHNLLKRSVQR